MTSQVCIVKECEELAEPKSKFCTEHKPPSGPFGGFLTTIATTAGTEAAKELIKYLIHHAPDIITFLGKHVGLREALEREAQSPAVAKQVVRRAILAINEAESADPSLSKRLKGVFIVDERSNNRLMTM